MPAARTSSPVSFRALAASGLGPPASVAAAGAFSKAQCGAGSSGAVVSYGEKGCAMLSFPRWDSEFPQVVELIGTKLPRAVSVAAAGISSAREFPA